MVQRPSAYNRRCAERFNIMPQNGAAHATVPQMSGQRAAVSRDVPPPPFENRRPAFVQRLGRRGVGGVVNRSEAG